MLTSLYQLNQKYLKRVQNLPVGNYAWKIAYLVEINFVFRFMYKPLLYCIRSYSWCPCKNKIAFWRMKYFKYPVTYHLVLEFATLTIYLM